MSRTGRAFNIGLFDVEFGLKPMPEKVGLLRPTDDVVKAKADIFDDFLITAIIDDQHEGGKAQIVVATGPHPRHGG